jgi:hypothetical protein
MTAHAPLCNFSYIAEISVKMYCICGDIYNRAVYTAQKNWSDHVHIGPPLPKWPAFTQQKKSESRLERVLQIPLKGGTDDVEWRDVWNTSPLQWTGMSQYCYEDLMSWRACSVMSTGPTWALRSCRVYTRKNKIGSNPCILMGAKDSPDWSHRLSRLIPHRYRMFYVCRLHGRFLPDLDVIWSVFFLCRVNCPIVAVSIPFLLRSLWSWGLFSSADKLSL